jgi:putative ABC transport system permease protein
MTVLLRVAALFTLALRRLAHQRALTSCLLLGMTLAVALATAIPAYVNVAQAGVLRQRLQRSGVEAGGQNAAFGLTFTYISTGGPRSGPTLYGKLNDYVLGRGAPNLVLPVRAVNRTISTDRFRVYGSGETEKRYAKTVTETSLFQANQIADPPYLFFSSLDVIDGIENHISFDEGRAPTLTPPGQPIETMIERGFANNNGIVAGDTFTIALSFEERIEADGNTTTVVERFVTVPMVVTGVWRANAPKDDFWTISPTGLRESFVITEQALFERVMRAHPNVVTLAIWNVILDAESLTIDLVDPITSRVGGMREEIFQLSKDFSLSSRAFDALNLYRRAASEMNLVLTVFSLPAFAMIIYFLALIAGMVVRQQEGELAILQSRGLSSAGVFALYGLQSGLLAIAALLLGLPLGMAVAGLIANTRSFLDINVDLNTFAQTFRLSTPVLRTALIAAAGGALVILLPVLGAAGRNIISHGASRARSLKRPLWQRAFLDLLLLLPCAYGYIQLRQRGSLATLTSGLDGAGELGATIARLTAADDPFRDPVRFLIPVLTVTALGLLAARMLPPLIGLLARIIGRFDVLRGPTLPVFLALRELARSPGDYVAPLILLTFTLGVAIFGASAARTLDQHLVDSTRLKVGGDTRLIEGGESNRPAGGSFDVFAQVDNSQPEIFNFPPVEDHLKLDGVLNYARVARFTVRPQTIRVNDSIRYTHIAVDRRSFQQIAASAFRPDYATRPFGDLMNALGRTPSGALAHQRFLDDNGLRVGDQFALVYATDGRNIPVTYTVVGGFTYFPVVGVSEVDVGFVSNIGYTFARIGKDVPYDVLLDLAPGTSGRATAFDAVDTFGFLVKDVEDATELIREEQARPERQGLFGMLSASFLFVTLLTLTGFAVYSLLTFRRRSIEIGVMRAMGLSSTQMALYVVCLQSLVVLLGAAAGGAIGLLVSRLFVPFLQIGGSLIQSVPPFVVRVAWQDAGLFYVALAIALAAVIVGSLILLRRLKVFEIVKLGGA